ncbi:hypothetical protein GKZ90_0021185 [Flavobacterium sp. MC2016-06]|jgi:hypothetical protein|uniref:hypothetical protein n=1 Tax=Flavobacterium sp. MC2016-06 TaxID=2676308 RepID=UPI0012BAE637|nr:hypothetical protein [Flavobacterium sp. MC2016-06]MBU3861016.1 hypothetical protein [Flavobacterium sp. MC2016-06]
MQPTKYSRETGAGIAQIKVTFNITSNDIEDAIFSLIEINNNIPTKTQVIDHIRYIARFMVSGGRLSFGNDYEDYLQYKDKVIETANKLFPQFYKDYRAKA